MDGNVTISVADFINLIDNVDELEAREHMLLKLNERLRDLEKRNAMYLLDVVAFTLQNVTIHGTISDYTDAMRMIKDHFETRRSKFADVLVLKNIQIGDRAFEIPVLTLDYKEVYNEK
jgi:predicted RNA-binding protein with EMAP domain